MKKTMYCSLLLLALLLLCGCSSMAQHDATIEAPNLPTDSVSLSDAQAEEALSDAKQIFEELPPCTITFYGQEDYADYLMQLTKSDTELQQYLLERSFDINGLYSRKEAQALARIMEAMPFPSIPAYELDYFGVFPERGEIILHYRNAESKIVTAFTNYMRDAFDLTEVRLTEETVDLTQFSQTELDVLYRGEDIRPGTDLAAFRYKTTMEDVAYEFWIYGSDEDAALQTVTGIRSVSMS